MSKLVFDIETIGEDYESLDETSQEMLTRWIKKESYSEDGYEQAIEEAKQGMGFSPLTGEIVAIAMLDVEKNKGAVYYQDPEHPGEEFEEDLPDGKAGGTKYKSMPEAEMLAKFWEGVRHYDAVVTFNGRAFDVPFLMVRSAIHHIRPSVNLMPPRFTSYNHIDLLDQLSFYGTVRKKGNLHFWCRAFGITSPKAEGVSGDDVAALFKAKEYKKIAQYNMRDVQSTRELYLRWEEFMKF